MIVRFRTLYLSLAAVVLLALMSPFAFDAAWRARHPAPLGRSAPAVAEVLARALPTGTRLDSAARFLQAAGVDYSLDSVPGSSTLVGIARNVDTDIMVSTSVRIYITFDAAGRLTARRTEALSTGM
jgi:hypothetical protein